MFRGSDEDEDDDNERGLDPKWNWFSMVERLAGGDILKMEEVFKTTVFECFNMLSYWKEKEEYIKELEKNRKK